MSLTLLAFTVGCADETEAPEVGTPVISGVSAQSIVIGETLEFFGADFLSDEDGMEAIIRLQFTGQFEGADGTMTPVNLQLLGVHNEEADTGRQILTIRRFGPYHNPFTRDARVGTFRGDVQVVRESDNGTVVTGSKSPLILNIEPSISILGFEPYDAECGAPAVRALAGMLYKMKVRVAGFRAVKFVYELNNVNGFPANTPLVVTHDIGAVVAEDDLGLDEGVMFNPVPSDTQFYVSGIRVTAYDADGKTVETAMPISVHRPIEIRYGGEYELAEVYHPMPVSGCIPGALGGRVEYRETETETRQQSVNLTVNRNWRNSVGRSVTENLREGIAVGESQSRTRGNSTWEGDTAEESYGVSFGESAANNVNVSSRDGESWNWSINEGESNEEYTSRMNMIFGEGSWSMSVGVSGEGSVPGFAKVGGSVDTTVGIKAGASTAGTTGNRRRISTDTGYGMSGSRDETRSFGSTVGESRSESLGGSYSLSTSRQRRESETEARDSSRTWNFAQGATASETITDGRSEAESRTWVSSESLATSQSLRGAIPKTKVGMFYRQTSRWVRRAEVRTYDMCGLAHHAGELQFNEWTWAVELAIANDCVSDPPPSRLPAANCAIEPCGG
jgi:hypothetical protein